MYFHRALDDISSDVTEAIRDIEGVVDQLEEQQIFAAQLADLFDGDKDFEKLGTVKEHLSLAEGVLSQGKSTHNLNRWLSFGNADGGVV